MFGRSLKLFRILGFDVRVDISWTFFGFLIATSLALGLFPAVYEGWPASTYWWIAVGGVIDCFDRLSWPSQSRARCLQSYSRLPHGWRTRLAIHSLGDAG